VVLKGVPRWRDGSRARNLLALQGRATRRQAPRDLPEALAGVVAGRVVEVRGHARLGERELQGLSHSPILPSPCGVAFAARYRD